MYLCDTKYTWDWRHYDYKSEVMELSVEQLRESISGYDCRHLVITGGEPLLQQKGLAPLVRSLAERASPSSRDNGTIAPGPQLERDIDQWNVSPKLANSGNAPHRRETSQALRSFSALANAYFKFVVGSRFRVEEVCCLVQKYRLPRERVILMPEGQTPETLQERADGSARCAFRRGSGSLPGCITSSGAIREALEAHPATHIYAFLRISTHGRPNQNVIVLYPY